MTFWISLNPSTKQDMVSILCRAPREADGNELPWHSWQRCPPMGAAQRYLQVSSNLAVSALISQTSVLPGFSSSSCTPEYTCTFHVCPALFLSGTVCKPPTALELLCPQLQMQREMLSVKDTNSLMLYIHEHEIPPH